MFKKKFSLTVKSLIVGVLFIFAVTTYFATITHSNHDAIPLNKEKSMNLIENLSSNENHVVPFNIQLINNVYHIGSSAYENTFTLSPKNGSRLNVSIKNNHSSNTVIFKVIHETTNTDFGFLDVQPSMGLTRSFSLPNEEGLYGTWKIYVTSHDGHIMDITVDARQY